MMHRFSWEFPRDHPALAGHFPGQPIAPGAVLLDRLELFAQQVPGLADRPLQLAHVKFLRSAQPGADLSFVFESTQDGRVAFRVECQSVVLARGALADAPGSPP
jgi:3-hydroxymyristoyl/3-hydroxydecanoyl-(acyl carrier protein) dehydratase